MSDPKPDASGLVPGLIGVAPDGSVPESPAAPPGIEIRTRYFVAVNAVLTDGSHALRVLTRYFHTLPAADRALEEVRAELPTHAKPEIFWTHSTYDTNDPGQAAELHETDAATAAERSAEGMQ